MITFLTTFKPFGGDDALRQRNALLSWLALHQDVEVLVFGRSPGLAPLVQELGLVHYPDVACIDDRLPRVDVIFDIAQRYGKHELQAYVNGDIVLGPDFLVALQRIRFRPFLMVGQRWDTRVPAHLADAHPLELAEFRADALRCGSMHNPSGIDYFAYRRGTLGRIPPLAVGAVSWDNFMIEHCRRGGIPVIDSTPQVLAIHQDHGYALSPGGEKTTVDSPAADHNRQIVGSTLSPYTVLDGSHLLTSRALIPAWVSHRHLRHRLLSLPVRCPRWRWLTPGFIHIGRLLNLLDGCSWLRHWTAERLHGGNVSSWPPA